MNQIRLHGTLAGLVVIAALCGSALAQDPEEVDAWAKVKGSESAEQLKGFLEKFPAGMFARDARREYSLTTSEVVPPEVESIDVRFPPEARRIGRSLGALRVAQLSIVVQADGKARDVDLVKRSGFDRYDSAARQAALAATYLPAVNHGMPVESRMDYAVSFGLLCNRAASRSVDCDGGRFPQECSATVCALLLR